MNSTSITICSNPPLHMKNNFKKIILQFSHKYDTQLESKHSIVGKLATNEVNNAIETKMKTEIEIIVGRKLLLHSNRAEITVSSNATHLVANYRTVLYFFKFNNNFENKTKLDCEQRQVEAAI